MATMHPHVCAGAAQRRPHSNLERLGSQQQHGVRGERCAAAQRKTARVRDFGSSKVSRKANPDGSR